MKIMSDPASLSASIFGSEGNSAQSSSLSGLFEESTKLPQTPNNLNFTEPTEDREKRERKEEKRKKRKQKSSAAEEEAKNNDEKDDGTDPTNKDEELTVFVGNLPENIDRKSLASMFKSCGKIKSTRIRSIATTGVKVAPEFAGNQVGSRQCIFSL